MTKRTVLQVPIKAELRDKAQKKADAEGFSSLQEVVRLMLSQYSKGETELLAASRFVKKYDKMIDDVRSGKVKTVSFDNPIDALEYLNK